MTGDWLDLSALTDGAKAGAFFVLAGALVAAWAVLRFWMRPTRAEAGDDWDTARLEVWARREALHDVLYSVGPDAPRIQREAPAPPTAPPDREAEPDLAAIDLFVEKAQLRLTERGGRHQRLGNFYGTLVFSVLLWAVAFLLCTVPDPKLGADTWAAVVARILWSGAVVGLFLGAAFFLGSLAQSHLHESTTLLNKRHVVRLGRLFLYLKFQGESGRNLSAARRALTVEDMERAFGSVHETSTAFRNIKPEVLTNTLLGTFAKAFASMGKPAG